MPSNAATGGTGVLAGELDGEVETVLIAGRITKPTTPMTVSNTAAIAAARRIRDRLRRLGFVASGGVSRAAVPNNDEADATRGEGCVSRSAIGAATMTPPSTRSASTPACLVRAAAKSLHRSKRSAGSLANPFD